MSGTYIVAAGIIVALVATVAVPLVRGVRTSKRLIERAVPYSRHMESPAMRILVVGDSTAVGVGAAHPNDSVAGRLGQRYPEAAIEVEAVSGMKLAQLDRRLDQFSGRHFNLVLLQIGANDVVGFTRLSDVRASLTSVLSKARLLSDRTIVMTAGNIGLAPVFKQPLAALISWRTRAVRSMFMSEVATHPSAVYIDLYKEASDEPFNTDIPRFYAADRFHPSGEGYGIWFAELSAQLSKDK